MGRFLITEEERKHIMGLYEQKTPVNQTPKKTFKINKTNYQINQLIPLKDGWNKLEYVKVLPNGMIEKAQYIGYIKNDNPKFVYQSQSVTSSKIGPSDIDLVVSQNVKPVQPKPQPVEPKPQPVEPKPQPVEPPTQPTQNYIQSLKDGITNIFKNKDVVLKDNILSVGDVQIKLSGNKIVELSIPKAKTIDGQILPKTNKYINIDLESVDLKKALSILEKEINTLSGKQSSSFDTTVPERNPTLRRDVPYQGTALF
jgi:hypothetical protein